LHRVDKTSRRIVHFRNTILNVTSWSNKEENHKYSILFFIPVVLFNQFRQFGNFFYLLMTITQFFDVLKVGFLFTYLSPLCMVVGFSMLKELYDDIKRRMQDSKTNSTLVTVLKSNQGGTDAVRINKKSSDLEIGDIITLTKDSRVPADIVVLKTYNESNDNQAFIRTDQLDGETDWKLRKAPNATQEKNEKDLVDLDGFIQYEPPSKLIYNFEGVIVYKNNNEDNSKKEPLNLENTMWASTVVASEKIIGIVIYTGKETRARMNSSTPKLKIGILDQELNMANVYLFVIMFFVSLLISALKGFNLSFILVFFRFIVLFCAIIPIALRVNLDVSKTWFSYVISKDELIPNTIARNSTIPEELGRISYIFSDKTGTLTKNEMIFKKIAMENEQFGEESFNDLKEILSDECQSNDAPLLDVVDTQRNSSINLVESNDKISLSPNNSEIITSSNESYQSKPLPSQSSRKTIKRIRRTRNKIIRDTISAMVLCNNVTPTETGYQASSPDEIALVKFAEKLNMRLYHRTDREIKLKNSADTVEEYEVLANFPFSSDTKRMGIVLKNKAHGHIIYYLKGAENVMMKFVKKDYIGYIKENAENLAVKGLRTLVLTQKLLTQEEFDKWNEEYNDAITSMDNRKEKIAQAVSKLENNMDFLCVTGVEDLLQDEVATTIDNLRNAGMKVWMLTGDKVETATCISISAGIKAKNQKIFTIRYDDLSNFNEKENKEDNEQKIDKLRELLSEYNRKIISDPHLFIIDGDSLDLALNYCEKQFFETSMKALSVVCCRCSPTQKRIIVKTIKKYTSARTAAVGDGGNDVAMIQEADVGIGIVGKEGLQASLAADYSIKEFKSLSGLLLWWGRIAYKNTSMVANFVIHRGLIISFNQFIFSLIFYYNAVALYNGMLSFGYSTVFTCLPSISILLDRDVDRDNVLKFPTLYKVLLKGRELNFKNFLFWLFKSLFQSAVIMFGSVFMFEEDIFLNIVTVSFTALIYLEILNVYMEINKWHFFMAFALIGTFIVYTLTLLFLPSYLDVYIFDFMTMLKIIILALIAWAPFFIYNKIKKIFFPQTIEKLNKSSE
jgi:phospholipid-translocating ATPase